MRDILALTIELLFALVFLRALVSSARGRDPLGRDVMLVFSAMAGLFMVEVAERILGEPPGLIRSLASLLLLAQPYLTLRLVARLRPVRLRVRVAALFAYAATAVPMVLLGERASVALMLAAVTVFAVVEALAATYLGGEARLRTGSPRVRLAAAALATVLFALAIVAAGAGAADVAAARAAGDAAVGLALLAAVGYLVAFLPPAWLRRMWGATTAYAYSQQLSRAPAEEPVEALWRSLCEAACQATGSDAAAVLRPDADGSVRVVAGVHVPDAAVTGYPAALLEQLLAARPARVHRTVAAPLGEGLAASTGARFVTALSLDGGSGGATALVLLSRYRSLFSEDDLPMLGDLGNQTAGLVERRVLLAEKEQLAAELSETVQALRGANQAKSDFVASMSHELRTPLNAIIGFSDLMRGGTGGGDTRTVPAEWIDHIHRSGQHLLSLINDVLELAKIEAGRLDLTPEPFDLRTGITESVAGLRPLAERKRLRLVSDVEAGVVMADPRRFRQILYNLLSNAIKFTPEGGEVRLVGRFRTHEVQVSVADTGIGIAPDEQAGVFEEFQQVGDPALRQSGTGLGLALTRRLVEAHGGSIELESAPGRGSRFTVRLPTDGASALAPPHPQDVADAPRDDGAAGDILVVEDDPGAARLLRAYLEREGYSVRICGDGETALAAARRQRPAAVILDVLLPGVDGWEVLRRLKSDDRLQDVPVIIVTVVDEREVGLALGADDYFVKPVDGQQLLTRLGRYRLSTKVLDRPVRILVVDDDLATREMLQVILRQEGFDVTSARGGLEALDVARRESLDLVICDLLMPDLDGFGVVAGLKADEGTRDTPILVLTGQDLTDEDKARLNGDILGVLRKGEAAEAGLREWLARVLRRTDGLPA